MFLHGHRESIKNIHASSGRKDIAMSVQISDLNQQQLVALNKLLKGKRGEERQKIANAFMAEIEAQRKPQTPTVQDAQEAIAQREEIIDNIPEDKIKELPEKYAARYRAAKTQEEQTEIIKEYYADSQYHETKTVNVGSGESVFGNRNAKKHEGGTELSYTSTKLPLVDGEGKPIQEAQEVRFETVKTAIKSQIDQQLAEIDKNATLKPDEKTRAKETLVLNEALNTSLKPQVIALAEEIKNNPPTENKMAYYELALTQDEKGQVDTRAGKKMSEMEALLGKKELTEDDKNKLDQYKKDFNTKFPDEEPFGEEEHLYDLNRKNVTNEVKGQVHKRLAALAKVYAIEEHIGGTELSAERREQLAKAQIAETVTHENEITKLSAEGAAARKKGDVDAAKKYEDKIAKLTENKNKLIGNIRKGYVTDQAQAQVEFETTKQNFENTTVHWNKGQAKAAEKDNPTRNNTHLNKYAQNYVKDHADTFCDVVTSGDFDFEVEGKKYKLNSDKYKAEMLRLSNSQREIGDTQNDADYYASTKEWSDFADKRCDEIQDKKGKQHKPASLNDRKNAQRMYEVAGIQTASNRDLAKRAGKFGKDALIGAGAGALTALGGELYKAADKLHFGGSVDAVVQGIASSTISGVASGTTTVSGTVTNTFESTVQKYDPNTGKYITIGHQVTQVPTEWTQDINVDVPYEKRVDIPYNDKTTVDYNGSVSDKFNPMNIVKGAGIGAGLAMVPRAIRYVFGKKTDDDYAKDYTVRDAFRENTGFKTQQQQQQTVTQYEPVKVTVEETKIGTQEDTKDIPIQEYRIGNKETIANIIAAKYNVTVGSDDYWKIFEYVMTKANGLPMNGHRLLKAPEAKTVNGKYGQYINLPEWVPADITGKKVGRDDNAKVKKQHYKIVRQNTQAVKSNATYKQVTKTTTQQTRTDIYDPKGRKRE